MKYSVYMCVQTQASLSLLCKEVAYTGALRIIEGYRTTGRGMLSSTSCRNFRAGNFPCKILILAHFCQADSPNSAHLKVGKGKVVFAVSKVLPLDTFSRRSGREEKKKSVESNALPATN